MTEFALFDFGAYLDSLKTVKAVKVYHIKLLAITLESPVRPVHLYWSRRHVVASAEREWLWWPGCDTCPVSAGNRLFLTVAAGWEGRVVRTTQGAATEHTHNFTFTTR